MGLNDPTSLVDFTPTQVATMKCAIILLLATVAYARPADLEEGDSAELLRSDVAHPDDDGGSIMVGHFTYIVDGEAVPLTFVANEKGYQPESSLLPLLPLSLMRFLSGFLSRLHSLNRREPHNLKRNKPCYLLFIFYLFQQCTNI